ncbi:DNA primase [Virgibacillus profundi]|uniref:DNA primase n=1 Tax=Virgibacillus profundi TaxID=2024555 RepID=A0A2A2ID32_9BACI|nr:DNA primase [Virgibacillus profundi]PAV29040.1 DNA primase [Virgibacillus profundi]PXY53209.1 DNA primase [Virgibacillus profundi]
MANQIPEEVIEEIRKANDIVDVIGEYVQLKKQGRNFFGLCPFHGEKTPSFSVTQEKQIFHCFGCGKGGNVVTFLMEMESFSFYEALKFLSERSGIDLPDSGVKHETSMSLENQNILSAYEWLTKLYHHLLRFTKDGKEGYSYFKDRGVMDESIDEFQLGFAPNVKDFTAEFLVKKGFHQQLLIKAGLVTLKDDNSVTDRFRGRVIFPIRNHLGKTVAFGARSITDQGPKYLNSSETELFQKGKLLFNFDLAKRYIRKESEAVLFEGYMDVISAYQAGVKNVVATMGTALTESQAKLLKRYVDTVILCYDGDRAGLEATYKAANLLRSVGCIVKIAKLNEDMDPDSFIKENGAEAFQNEVIKASDTFISFYMRFMKQDYNLSVEGDRINYIATILNQLAMIDSPVEREYYVKELSNEFDFSMDTLTDEIQTIRQKKGIHKDKREKNRYTNKTARFIQNKKLLPAFHNAERKLISYMLQDAYITDKVQTEIGAGFNLDEHKIIATYLYAYYEEGHPADVSLFIEKLTDERVKHLVIEIAMNPLHNDISDKEIDDYIKIIHAENGDKHSIKTLQEQSKLAEQQNDPIKAAQILKQIIEIQKQMKNTN